MRCLFWMCLMLSWGSGVAGAAPLRIDEGDVVVLPDGGNLPVGAGVTKDDALRAAYTLPAVQAAITFMVSRGYVAYPVYDDAALLTSPPATFVALSFEKPGLITPSFGIVGAPMILIGTVRDAWGRLRTSVTGGLAFMDTTAEAMWTADSLPNQYPDDASYEVVPAGGGNNIDDGLQRVLPHSPESTGPFDFHWGGSDSPEDQKFRRFMSCSTMGLASTALRAAWTPPPIPQKIVLQAAIFGVLSIATCGVGVYGGGMP
jgi:hypothetical protein